MTPAGLNKDAFQHAQPLKTYRPEHRTGPTDSHDHARCLPENLPRLVQSATVLKLLNPFSIVALRVLQRQG
ncbi:hypothetical protein ABIE13_002555 [Ottowia thiooxydans]|uniref:Uncharacterized protein n=1 Tax=Ottowia thiooxydans TaxID=219182 RepID=A0ABV2Q8S2_9BURK